VANVQPATAQVQPIYILQQPQSAPVAQVQPTTTVEAPAIRESRADQLRKQREDLERQTEDKLMQKLEDDRVLSEKERSERIFNLQPAATPTAAPAPAPVIVQQPPSPAPVAVQQAPVLAPEAVVTTKIDGPTAPASEEDKSKFSIGGLAGLGAYPSVNNVSGTYSVGAGLSIEFPERLGVEIAALFSSYRVTNANSCVYPYCVSGGGLVLQLNQTNIIGGLTYHILDTRVSPVIGALAGYTRRSYSNLVTYGINSSTTSGSNALDGGILVGVDIMATKKLSIGADFRYMMNISYTTDNALAYYGPILGNPVETLNYYIASITLKLAL